MTERRRAILFAIIEQYAEVASPVGSVTLAKLFGVSSATIRSEMAWLEKEGLISQPHTSAGRIPTDQGYRMYVNYLTQSKDHDLMRISERSVRAIEARVHARGDRADRIIRAAVDSLVDNIAPWLREASLNEPLNVYIGSENPIGSMSGSSLIVSRFRSPYSNHSYIGVLGPTRQSYAKVMRLVHHTGQLLEQVLKEEHSS